MSSLSARTNEAKAGRQGDGAPPGCLAVFYTLDGAEHASAVPAGADRWDVVAGAVAARLRCGALAEAPPAYDTGTRNWTLPVTLLGRRGRSQMVHVPVRW